MGARYAWPLLVVVTALGTSCGKDKARIAPATADAEKPHELAVGDKAPVYSAVSLRGDSVSVGTNGTLSFLNVWATWCTSCREEMEDLQRLHREFGKRGLRVVAVSVDNGDGLRVRRFVAAHDLTFPVVHDPDGNVQLAYGTVAVPESYLVGRDGRILWRQAGGLHGGSAAARTAIESALANE